MCINSTQNSIMVNNYQRGHIVDHRRMLAYSIFDTIRYVENMVEHLRNPDYMGPGMGSFPVDDALVRHLFEALPTLYYVDHVDHESLLPDLIEGVYINLDDWFFRFGVRIDNIDSDTDSTDPISVLDMPLLHDFDDTDSDSDLDYSVNTQYSD